MIRLGIIGEGISEETFAREMLCPHLTRYNIFAYSRQIVTSRRVSLPYSKGGIHSYDQVKKDVLKSLREDATCIITTMLDLYALPTGFPEYEKANTLSNPYERIELLEKSFAADISHVRFIPYIQLHEFEALFFTNIKISDEILSLNSSSQLSALEEIVNKYSNPELINKGPQTAPSKRILQLYPQYQKSVDSIRILQRIELHNIRLKCRHFHEWLSKLESLTSSQ